jgi:hypothetical protein
VSALIIFLVQLATGALLITTDVGGVAALQDLDEDDAQGGEEDVEEDGVAGKVIAKMGPALLRGVSPV